MKLPIIGLTTSRTVDSGGTPIISINEVYSRAVQQAGGLPVMIPTGLSEEEAGEIFSRMDGLLFTGGGDINPAIFNGDPNQHVYHIDQERDSLEIFLVRQAAEKGFPFFGICRGIQVINVALGGKLYTDIHDQLPGALRHDNHNKLARDETAHLVAINPKTRLESLVGTGDLPVNSFHHQGIESLGASLQATAYAPDGLIEAVEIPGHPFGLGVQWHPEWMTRQKLMLELFRGFVRAAGNG